MQSYRIYRVTLGVRSSSTDAMCGSDTEARDLAQRMLSTPDETADVWQAGRPVATVSKISVDELAVLVDQWK